MPFGHNGWIGWNYYQTAVTVVGFSHFQVSSLDYIDAYWLVQVDPIEGEEFALQHHPYILGISYYLNDPTNITYYRTWVRNEIS